MFLQESYESLNSNLKNISYQYVDVRSPMEFSQGTIPAAINIPIFNNEERDLVGKKYKRESKDLAKQLGIEIVSKKLPSLYENIKQIEKDFDRLILFCSRGGYRSSTLVSFLSSIGLKVTKLEGGYKEYRNYIINKLPQIVDEINFIVLYGNTGTGKTHILEDLKALGYDTLDLEACANHRGSMLGSVGLGDQHSQKMFESLVFDALNNRKSNTVFVEGESRRIGKDLIPLYLFEAMKKGTNIKITADMDTRLNNILKDYVHNTDDELIEALDHLRKYLGNESIDNYIDLIKSNDYKTVIEELITKYYDPLYGHNTREYEAVFHSKSSEGTAKDIASWMENITIVEQ